MTKMSNKHRSRQRRSSRAGFPTAPRIALRKLDLASVDRIIRTTLSAPGGDKLIVISIDRKTLIDDLDDALTHYLVAAELGSPLAEQRDQRWEDIHKTSRKLLSLLREDQRDSTGRRIGSYYPRTEPNPSRIILLVAFAAIRARRRIPNPPGWRPYVEKHVRWLTSRSPGDFLIGELLAPVFERYFAKVAGYTTREIGIKGSITDGPFIRFADAVLKECGLKNARGRSYSLSSIANALTNARKGRARRKHAA